MAMTQPTTGLGADSRLPSSSVPLLRVGAVPGVLGLLVYFVADVLHDGHDPAHLETVLPEYASNADWLAVHLGQFGGIALLTVAMISVAASFVRERPSSVVGRLVPGAALVTLAVHAVDQAVDGIATKFVAQAYVDASADERAAQVLLVADAVRHIEIGLTGMFQLLLGLTLALMLASSTSQTPHGPWTDSESACAPRAIALKVRDRPGERTIATKVTTGCRRRSPRSPRSTRIASPTASPVRRLEDG